MTTHHFLASAIASPPVSPSERWLLAFPQGRWSNWTTLQQQVQASDLVWVPVSLADWRDKVGQLSQRPGGPPVVVLSPVPNDTEGLRAIHAGARGYCHLQAVPELLREVAEVVQHGGLWVGPELVARMVAATRDLLERAGPGVADSLPPIDWTVLSHREAEVARAVAAGASNREVAERLHISERTVKAHLGAVFEKIGVRDRVQLVLRLSPAARSHP